MKSNWNYPTTMWVGKDRIKDLSIACKTLNMSKPLLVTDKGLAKSKIIVDVVNNLKDDGILVELYSNVVGNPTGTNVNEGVDFFNNDIRLIIVPHEVQEGDLKPIENLLNKKGLSHQRITQYEELNPSKILIVDKVGILADLYAYAKIAYIGAGFSTGVHSVIEPAAHKCLVVYGPRLDILDEAVEMAKINAAIVINSGIELAEVFFKIKYSTEIKKLGNSAYQFIIKKEYASKRIINEIFS